MVEFCPKCGSMMIPKKVKGRTILVCTSCGYVKKVTNSEDSVVLRKKIRHRETEKMFIIDTTAEEQGLPKTKGVRCPKCGNDEAYYVILQTRAADEPPTRIYRCTKCGYTWREYE